MSAVLLTVATVCSTSAGGLCAAGLRERLHLLLALTAGALLGVVAFDLLPEIFALAGKLGRDPLEAMIALTAGFLALHAVEKFVLVHPAHEHDYAPHRHPGRGVLSAAALVVHSFIDGVGMGLAFQLGPGVGVTVAVAVIAHDFCDGLNTVALMLAHGNPTRRALGMLALDALAPGLGVASTLVVSPPPGSLLPYLGFFAGFLLYIGVADVLPQAHGRAGPQAGAGLIALTVLGAALVYALTRLAGAPA
jgi:zinc transporter ZupT